MTKQKRMYGTWDSPISPSQIAAGLRLNDVQFASDGETLVWLEGRGAPSVLVAQTGAQAPRDLTDASQSIRGRVFYGGGEFTTAQGSVYFVGNHNRLHRLSLDGGLPQPITPAFGAAAAPRVSADGKWIVYVHSVDDVDGLALVDSEGKLFPRKLAYGTDFVMQPAWNPQGTLIAYIAWDQPNMAWDGTELRLAHLQPDADGVPTVEHIEPLAGDEHTSIFQPEFSPDGSTLAYVSDKNGWWQLYLYDLASGTHTQLTDAEAEDGQPAWVQGVRTYGWSHDGKAIYFIRTQETLYSLWRCEISTHKLRRITALDHYADLSQISVSPLRDEVALIASSSTIPTRIITYEIEREGEEMGDELVHKRTRSEMLIALHSEGQAISWAGHDGETVYGLYYPPFSADFEGSDAPPLVVKVHGGPTSQTRLSYSPEVQFYTSRGFGFLEVNYRGSTGYGRVYRDKLMHHWGVYDVEDSASGAQYLVDQGLADGKRLVILGGSAGGYTVLQSLVDKPGFWRAGVCLYGVSNQFTLALETWKFEARYSDMLLGALPEDEAHYRDRSPLFHASQIKDPVIVFQGEDDPVVPKAQADTIVAALKRGGVPHEYHVFAGEGHGWRKPETIERYYALVLAFLKQYVIFG